MIYFALCFRIYSTFDDLHWIGRNTPQPCRWIWPLGYREVPHWQGSRYWSSRYWGGWSRLLIEEINMCYFLRCFLYLVCHYLWMIFLAGKNTPHICRWICPLGYREVPHWQGCHNWSSGYWGGWSRFLIEDFVDILRYFPYLVCQYLWMTFLNREEHPSAMPLNLATWISWSISLTKEPKLI